MRRAAASGTCTNAGSPASAPVRRAANPNSPALPLRCPAPAPQMRLSMVSSNLLAEPYRGQPPRLPLTAYFTLAGWKEVWRRFMSNVKSLYTLAKCQ